MMTNLVLEILIVFLLLLANGVFAMAEIAIVSARKSRLQQLADDGNLQARNALRLANNPNRFLATIQIGITLIGILAGAFGGATLAQEIAQWLERIPLLAPYGETIGVVAVVLLITYFSLIIGELVPKRLGLNNAERIASTLAAPMQFLSMLSAPLVRFVNASTDLVIRILGVKPSDDPMITPEEIRVLIKQGTEIGIFESSEQDMIDAILRLDEQRISTFMTPRTRIIAIEIGDPIEEIRQKIAGSAYSSFPVVRDELDNVLGIVHTKDLLNQFLAGESLDLSKLIQDPLIVPESISALHVLEKFSSSTKKIALVADEYGGIEGVVTHRDILEDIAGAFPTSGQALDPLIVPRSDGSKLIDGLLPIDELKELYKLKDLPGEEHGRYQTLGGFIMSMFGSIPQAGQSFAWEYLCFEVVDMDGHRVDKVLITPFGSDPKCEE